MSRDVLFYSLHVVKAVGLPLTLFRHSPRAYVEIRFGSLFVRTKTSTRTQEPHWDEHFQLSSEDPSTTVSLHVKHDLHMLPDSLLGVSEIDTKGLAEMAKSGQDNELTLIAPSHKDAGKERGRVVVKITVLNEDEVGATTLVGGNQALQSSDISKSQSVSDSKPAALVSTMIDTVENPPSFVVALEGVVSKLDVFVKLVDEAAKVHPYINIAWTITSSLYKAVRGQVERDAKITKLMNVMKDVYSFVDAIKEFPEKIRILEDTVLNILKQTVECVIFIREYSGHGFGERLLTQTFSQKDDTIDGFMQKFADLKKKFDSAVNVQTAFVSLRVSEGVDRLVRNMELRPTEMDASLRPECQPDTRVDTINFITDWLTCPSDNQNVLLLYGLAGSGKSTLSTTVANYFREIGRLGAFLFFDRSAQSDPSIVIRTLAYKLGAFDYRIGAAISASIKANVDIASASLHLQFSKLLAEPLSNEDLKDLGKEGPIVIILDALDECGSPDSREGLLKLFARLEKLPSFLRFFITSRPQPDIMRSFEEAGNIHSQELLISSESNQKDILSYLRRRLADIRAANSRRGFPQDWPGETAIRGLRAKSAGLFVWCSTAIAFLKQCLYPDERLDTLLGKDVREEAEFSLDDLYKVALKESGLWGDKTFGANFRAIFGTIICAKEPLLPHSIDKLLGFDSRHSSLRIIELFGCVLTWDSEGPIHLLHPSFADFLCDRKRCGNDGWFVDRNLHNRLLASACFRVMDNGLHFNICGLQTSHSKNEDVLDLNDRVKTAIPSQLSYSCRFWAEHVVATVNKGPEDTEFRGPIIKFFHDRFMFWLEALSLIKEALISPPLLLSMSEWLKDDDAELAHFVADARRFVIAFLVPISECAPHIYLSALPFAPSSSKVARHYLPQFSGTLSVDLGKPIAWPSRVGFLEGHSSTVKTVAFSPNGKRIVSGSTDNTIRVWDAGTGKSESVFEGHDDAVNSVAFSPDGKRIVSGSEDKTIRIWDVESGAMSTPFEGHEGPVLSVSFSPDGKRIISGSSDRTVRQWDAQTGKSVSSPLEGPSDEVECVAFSSDWKRIVSGSTKKTFHVWNAETGEVMPTRLEEHRAAVGTVAFSPDGKRIVSGSWDIDVHVWDMETGKIASSPFKGHGGDITSVAFSLDGNRIVSASKDKTIRVWNAETGEAVSMPLEGHSAYATSVAFSPDGKRVISGSYDNTICVWDLGAGSAVPEPNSEEQSHGDAVVSVVFSPDGKRIVSASRDKVIAIWDAETGKLVSFSSEGHFWGPTSVTTSPDGKLLASGSIDGIILRDAATAEPTSEPFELPDDHMVLSLAFSPDGKQLVSASLDNICVWDASTGKLVYPPLKASEVTSGISVAYSPDGTRIASGGAMCVWDVQTRQLAFPPVEGDRETGVMSVAYSPDGKRIISSSTDKTVRIWDAETGKPVSAPFTGHSGDVVSVAVSPDGKSVVSGSRDHTTRVWNAETGKGMFMPFEGHSKDVVSVAFSPDGKHIVSGSEDVTIRVWSVDASLAGVSENVAEGHTTSSSLSDTKSAIGFQDNSKLVHGWMHGTDSELLFWVPPDCRTALWWPRNTAVIGPHPTKLNLSKFVHGTSWAQCRRNS